MKGTKQKSNSGVVKSSSGKTGTTATASSSGARNTGTASKWNLQLRAN